MSAVAVDLVASAEKQRPPMIAPMSAPTAIPAANRALRTRVAPRGTFSGGAAARDITGDLTAVRPISWASGQRILTRRRRRIEALRLGRSAD
ncbi:hypothetical protein JCM12141A_04720 [Mycolicibacterium hodleri]